MPLRDQMRKGTTEMLILRLLTERPMYGYEVSQELRKRSEGYFDLKEGLLYPALHELAHAGYVTSEWREAGPARRRKYYLITDAGRASLTEQAEAWRSFIGRLLPLLDEG